MATLSAPSDVFISRASAAYGASGASRAPSNRSKCSGVVRHGRRRGSHSDGAGQTQPRLTIPPIASTATSSISTGFPGARSRTGARCRESPRSILFCREKHEEREIWDGFRYGPPAARERFGVDEARAIERLDEDLVTLLADQPSLFYAPGADADWDARVMRWLNAVRAQARTGVSAPARIHDVRTLLDEMRLVKDAAELATMRRAAGISAGAHQRAMRAVRPGRFEYEIEAELQHEFRRHGAQFPAYWPIVAGGANACVLHYRDNNARLRDGDLLLIDAGCELDGYAADITRTFPVNGRFGAAQREIYELVLAAQAAAIAEVGPGAAWNAPHDAAVRVLAQGLIDLGLLTARRRDARKEATSRFTCTAPATGWAWMCTMSATTRSATTGARCNPAWC